MYVPHSCGALSVNPMATEDFKTSFASQLSGTLLTPGDEGYEEAIKRWAGNSEKRAAFVALVASAEDISKTVIPNSIYADEDYLGK